MTKRESGTTGTRKRSSGDWSPRFLEQLANTANIRTAARAAGVGRSTVYRRRDSDHGFAQAMALAIEDAVDELEGEARRRAMEYSDKLLTCLLQRYRPEKFGRTLSDRRILDAPVVTLVTLTREEAADADREPEQWEREHQQS